MKKKIIGITGCRSEYDIIYSVMKEMQKDGSFDVSLIVCGAHLSGNFGYTVTEIERDGFLIVDRIHSLIDSDREVGKAKGAGILMMGLGDSLDRIQPDYAMVIGDREEAIVTGIVCTYLGIPLIHLCGGDHTEPKAGDVDEAGPTAGILTKRVPRSRPQARESRLNSETIGPGSVGPVPITRRVIICASKL